MYNPAIFTRDNIILDVEKGYETCISFFFFFFFFFTHLHDGSRIISFRLVGIGVPRLSKSYIGGREQWKKATNGWHQRLLSSKQATHQTIQIHRCKFIWFPTYKYFMIRITRMKYKCRYRSEHHQATNPGIEVFPCHSPSLQVSLIGTHIYYLQGTHTLANG